MRSWRVLRSEAASFGPRPRAFSGASQAPSWLAASARHELFARLHQLRKGKRKSEEVLLVIHECRRWNLIRDPRDWVVAMGALSRAQLWEETIGMLEDMHKDGGIAIHALNASVSAAGRATHWQTALALFGQAKRYAVLPDAVTSNAVLTACDKGGQWQRALNIFDDMKSSHSLEPNVITYSAVMSACEHGHAWQEALQVFRSMQDNNTAVDVVAVNAALSACDRGCRWQEALAMLANMGEGSLKASLTSFGSTISACGNALYWEAAIDLLRLLDEKQLKPGLIVWNLCINACRKARKLHAALALFKELPARSEQPDMLSFTSIASACASSAEWQLAVSFLEDATSCNQTPDTAFYNAILGVCREASQWEEAYRIMHELQEQGLAPTMSTFKAVIAACAYSMRWSDALDHLQALQRSQLVGTPREQEDLILQYGIVSKACQEAGLRHVAQRLLEEAEQSVPSDGLVSSLPAEWLSVLHWQAALSFFERKQAPKENAGVEVVGLADVLLEAGRDADAMSLLLEAQEERILRLWKGRKLDLHYLGPGSCSAAVAEAAVSATLLQLAHRHQYCARHDLDIVVGRGANSIEGMPMLLPAMQSFLDNLGLSPSSAGPGWLCVSRESLNSFWQGECAAVQSGWRVQSQAVLVP